MNYLVYATNPHWFDNISKLPLSENDEVAFWRTSCQKNFSKDINMGDVFLMSVKKDGKREVQGIATYEGFYNNIKVVELWEKYGKNTGATSLDDLLKQLKESGKKNKYSSETEISYIELKNVKCNFHLKTRPSKLL